MARSSTSFQSKWKLGHTTVLRVPEKLAPEVLRYAHELDDKSEPLELHDSPVAYRTAENVEITRPVNVASVPQRSPFRYPGGKTWLVPYIRSWLSATAKVASVLVEPFAGGGIVGLTAGFEGLAEHVVLVERDANIAAVWHTIFGGQAKWLADRIQSFKLNKENVLAVLKKEPLSQRERAFAVILRNRVQRGGIMAEGAGLVKTGENGRGLNSRWYPETLARRIEEISAVRERFSFVEGDAFEVIRRYADDDSVAFFLDPPYTVASKRLYTHWQIDHRSLFGLIMHAKGNKLLTYDNTAEIVALASEFGFDTKAVASIESTSAKLNKLLIAEKLNFLNTSTSYEQTRPRKTKKTSIGNQ